MMPHRPISAIPAMNRYQFRMPGLIVALALCVRAAPLSLGDAQARLFVNNLDILTAENDLQKAKAELAESKSAWWPSIDANASYTYQSAIAKIEPSLLMPLAPPGTIAFGFHDNIMLGADLTYPFFTGFSRRYGVAEHRESIAEKQASLQAARNAASLGLGITFLQWVLAYRQATVQQSLIESLDSYTQESSMRLEAGTALKSSFLDARARLQFAKADLVGMQDRIDSLRREIMSLLLTRDCSIVPDSTSVARLDTMRLPIETDTARPELIALNHVGEQVRLAREALRFRHFPTLAGDLGGRYGKPGLNFGIDQFMGWGLAGLSLNWNLFDGFRSRAQDVELQRQLDYVDIARTRQLEIMNRGFDDAKRQVESAAERLAACETSLAAFSALAIERKNQVENRAATSTDYLNALAGLAAARFQAEQATMAERIARLQLMYAAGKEIRY